MRHLPIRSVFVSSLLLLAASPALAQEFESGACNALFVCSTEDDACIATETVEGLIHCINSCLEVIPEENKGVVEAYLYCIEGADCADEACLAEACAFEFAELERCKADEQGVLCDASSDTCLCGDLFSNEAVCTDLSGTCICFSTEEPNNGTENNGAANNGAENNGAENNGEPANNGAENNGEPANNGEPEEFQGEGDDIQDCAVAGGLTPTAPLASLWAALAMAGALLWRRR